MELAAFRAVRIRVVQTLRACWEKEAALWEKGNRHSPTLTSEATSMPSGTLPCDAVECLLLAVGAGA